VVVNQGPEDDIKYVQLDDGPSRDDIEELKAMGFPEEQVVLALEANGKNKQAAIDYLLNQNV